MRWERREAVSLTPGLELSNRCTVLLFSEMGRWRKDTSEPSFRRLTVGYVCFGMRVRAEGQAMAEQDSWCHRSTAASADLELGLLPRREGVLEGG